MELLLSALLLLVAPFQRVSADSPTHDFFQPCIFQLERALNNQLE
jgi:hypothetical protein